MSRGSIVRLILYPTAGLLLLALYAFHWLCFTEGGGRVVVDLLSNHVAGLSMRYSKGTLARGLDVEQVAYRTSSMDVAAGHMHISLNLAALMAFRVSIGKLGLTDLRVSYAKPPTSGASSSVAIKLPFAVRIRDARATHVEVRIDGAAPVKLESAETSLALAGETLSLRRVSVKRDAFRLGGAGTVSLEPPFEFDSRLDLAVGSHGGVPVLMAHGRIHGNLHRILVEASLPSPDKVSLAGVVLPETGHFNATLDVARMALKRLTGMQMNLSGGRLQVAGSFARYRYDGRVTLDNPWVPGADILIKGDGDGNGVSLDGVKVTAKQLALSLNARYLFASYGLTASATGKVRGRQVTALAHVSAPDVARLMAEGYLTVAGNTLHFSSKTAGHISLRLDAPHPAAVYPRLAGRLTGEGRLETATGNYTIALSGPRLALAGQIFEGVTGRVDGRRGGVNVNLAASHWLAGGTRLGSIGMGYTGSDYTHGQLSLHWQRQAASLQLESSLAIAQGEVVGRILSGSLRAAGQTWRLAAEAPFRLGASHATLADQCWRQQDARLCVTGVDYAANTLAFNLQANRLMLAGIAGDNLRAMARLQLGSHPDYRLSASGDIAMPARNLAWNELQLKVSGNGSQFRYAADAAFINPWVKHARLSTRGTLSAGKVSVDTFRLEGGNTDVTASGKYDLALKTVAARLTGKWHGSRVEGSAALSGVPHAPAGKASLAVASNHMVVNLTKKDQFQGSVSANDLAEVSPAWQGSLTAKGQFDMSNSTFSFEGSSPGLKMGVWRIGSLQFQGKGQTGALHASATVSQAQYGGQPIGGGKIAVEGKLTHAALALSMQLAGSDLELHATLGYNRGALSGKVLDGNLAVGAQQWKLQQPFDFAAAAGVLAIGANCWAYADGRVCLREGHLAAQRGKVELNVARLPFAIDKPWFAPNVDLGGRLDATLSGSVDARSGKPVYDGRFAMDVPRASLDWQKGKTTLINLHAGGQINDNRLAATLAVKSSAHVLLSGQLGMPDLLEPSAFKGSASLATDKLGMVTAFIPQLGEATGSLHAAIGIDSLTQPLKANLSLKVDDDASADIPPAGITLKHLVLTASGDARKVQVDASATSGEGKVTAAGHIAEPFSAQRIVNFKVKGSKVTLLDRQDMKLVATPDLTVSDDAAGNMDVSGRFQVDDGHFKMSELHEQARRPSSDVVVVSGAQQAAPSSQTRLHLEVTVNKFNVDMYGLKSGVQGNVLLTQQSMSPRRAQGTVNLVKGTYSRFGQKFTIDKGRLMFSGPLDNPLVDVVTSRTITNANDPNSPVTVSLNLSGPANDIKSTITSTPAMSGANALAYLILGHPLSTSAGSESQAMSGAALALGLKQALPITRQIQSALGLSELTVASNGVDSTSVVAGKRIGPNLYMEYDYDVFSRIGGILFNYHLTPKLSLQTRTGDANSMQLLYNF